jgi:hypothetical protein
MTVMQLAQAVKTNMIPYDEAVKMGKKIMSEIEDRRWQLGDLADALEPKHGQNTLAKFAQEIGINFNTLMACRSTVRAWSGISRPRQISFETARELMALPDREAIARDCPDLTPKQARQIRKLRKAEKNNEEETIFPYQEPCTDCNTAEEQWQRSVANLLGDILTMRAYWDRLFGDDWKAYKIPSSHIKLAVDAKREINQMVAILKEHTRDEKN